MVQLVSYRDQQSSAWAAGLLVDGHVIDMARALGRSAPISVKELLRNGSLEDALRAIDRGTRLTLDSLELGPPVPDPDKVICVGLNYRDHAEEARVALPDAPVLFAKFPNSLTGPYATIGLPPESTKVDYEGEVAAIIGRRCRRVSEAYALDHVVGYSAFNDVSARDLQLAVSQWTTGKAIDGFAPMGPGIALAGDVGDPQALSLCTRVNGETVQDASTGSMVFSVAELIAYISRFITLEPGDIIATGTPGGVGQSRKPPLFLKAADVVEVEVERVGVIRNRMVSELGD